MEVRTTEMHTEGMPVRIITDGYPKLHGDTLLKKRDEVKAKYDHIRKCLMLEPRGHENMYGGIICEPTGEYPEADLTVMFVDGSSYGTMCGHASISIARYAKDQGKGKTESSGETLVNIHCPCGLVACTVSADGYTTLKSVPSWVVQTGVPISVLGKTVEVDVAYGGAFYSILDCTQLGIDVMTEPVQNLVQLGYELKKATSASVELKHPAGKSMESMYGAILTDGKENDAVQLEGHQSFSQVIFGEKQVDRSPCGSGSTARLALMHHKKQVKLNEMRTISCAKLPTNGFKCCIVEETEITLPGETTARPAVRVAVKGKGYYTGTSMFTVEDDDPLKAGFLID